VQKVLNGAAVRNPRRVYDIPDAAHNNELYLLLLKRVIFFAQEGG
jgi:hypothetical protein